MRFDNKEKVLRIYLEGEVNSYNADNLSNEIDNCTAVEAVDLETGAIVYGIYADEDTGGTVYEVYSNEEGPDNCDDDCGFDPFLGCYTDDV